MHNMLCKQNTIPLGVSVRWAPTSSE